MSAIASEFTKIDITLVSAGRPDLLFRTLESFSKKIFLHFFIVKLYANIDPIFGTDKDHAECKKIILEYFPSASIFEPEKPSFGASVKRLWAATSSSIILHMEDDWVCIKDITPDMVIAAFSIPNVRSASIANRSLGSRKKIFKEHNLINVLPDGTTVNKRVPLFGTSPRFLDGEFARRCSQLLDPMLDPEKQMRRPFNAPLNDFTEPYRDAILRSGDDGVFLIEDIDREWRDKRGISKIVAEGRSEWVSKSE